MVLQPKNDTTCTISTNLLFCFGKLNSKNERKLRAYKQYVALSGSKIRLSNQKKIQSTLLKIK
jgi:FAD synthase